MTRINTNVSSLIAQKTLGRTNNDLQSALTRLSTGLRINSGKDDPAGLIASESLRSDITSINTAIKNTERANQVIATADSALGQVSNLLNDIRGLVIEAANQGALSDDEIAANQLQIDSSLEAVNRIAQTTTFQGRRLLDGSLDFLTQDVSGFDTVTNLQVDQANLGPTGSVAVMVEVSAAATQAQIDSAGGLDFTGGTASSGTLTFTDITTPEVLSADSYTFTSTATLAIGIKSAHTDADIAGAGGDGVAVTITSGDTGSNAHATAAYNATTNALTITVDNTDNTGGGGSDNTAGVAISDIIAALNADTNFTDNFEFDTAGSGTFTHASDAGDVSGQNLTGGVTEVTGDDVITVTAAAVGPAFDGNINLVSTGGVGTGIVAAYDGTDINVTIEAGLTANIADIALAIEGLADYTAAVTATGADGQFVAGTDTDPAGVLAGGIADSGTGLADDLVVEISGATSSEVFTFAAGTTLDQFVSAVNLVSDATGVEATNNAGVLELISSEYGSSAVVDVSVISEGPLGTFATSLTTMRATGTDIDARVNGVNALGDGNKFSINTATLDLSLTVTDGSSTDISFNITGGGALFQLGPEVVSNQQARLGLQSLNTARLGGSAGRLYELASGGAKALNTNASGAARIVDQVIDLVTGLRGRLGAFQRTTLETNIASLNDTVTNLVEAESSIRDADFAKETAALTRSQILVQSGTSVLAIANQNPQNVLALLQ